MEETPVYDENKFETVPLDERFQEENTDVKVPERSQDILAVAGENLSTEQVKAKVSSSFSESWNNLFIAGHTFNKTAEQLNEEANSLRIKQEEFLRNPEFVLEQGLMANDSKYTDAETRFTTNMQTAQEVVSFLTNKTIIQDGESLVRYGLDFVDRFLVRQSLLIGAYEDLTGRKERKGYQILDRAASLPPDEFRKWFQSYAEEVSAEGVFDDQNIFALQQLQEELLSAGHDPDRGVNAVAALLDVPAVAALTKGTSALKKVATSLKSKTVAGRVAAVKGEKAAADASEALLEKSADPEVLGDVGHSITNLSDTPVKPSSSRWTNILMKNKLAQEINDIYQKGAIGRIASQEDIKLKADRIAKRRLDNITDTVHDIRQYDEGFGLNVVELRFGTPKEGAPYRPVKGKDGSYKPSESLERKAKELDEKAEVVPYDPSDHSKGYLIRLKERIEETDLIGRPDTSIGARDDLVRKTVGRLMHNPLTGSAALRDAETLTVLAQLGEGGQAAIQNLVRPYQKKIKSLRIKSQYTLDAVYRELRDGLDADLRARYNDTEFTDKYKELHPDKASPTQKELDAYHALADVEDATYLLKTVDRLRKFLAKGYDTSVEVGKGIFEPAKRVTKDAIGDDDLVMSLEDGIPRTKKLWGDDLKDEVTIWKLNSALKDGEIYVIKPKSIRTIEPEDVMGYNPGGSRINPFAKYFVVIGQKGKRLKALISAPSAKAANTAREQLKTIVKAIENKDPDIDDIISKNSDWNPEIQTYEQFAKLAKDEDWLLKGNIEVKGRDSDILSVDLDNTDIDVGSRLSDYVDNDMRRQDRVLLDYGGGRNYNSDPTHSVLAQYSNAAYTYSNKAYTRNAMVGWVKEAVARGRSWFPEGISPSDYDQLFRSANVTGNDPFANRMRELRNITLRRLNQDDEASRRMESLGQSAAEFVFDTTGKRLNLGDPTNALLKVGFQSIFGFFAPVQLLMQASHVTSIIAISPVHGLKAAAAVVTQRGILRTPDSKAYKEGVKRFAKYFELKEQEAEEVFEYIRTSGRAIVDGDAVEDGTGVGRGLSSWKGNDLKYSNRAAYLDKLRDLGAKGLDNGLYFFKTGERLSRLTAINTAILEYKKLRPGVSILTDEARAWITKREQALTFQMTTTSRAMVQSSLLKVPTQWMTYAFRSMESVFVGRELSKRERVRLFTVLAPIYGLAGFGAESAAGYVSEFFGVPEDNNAFLLIRSGFYDYILAELLGAENAPALGERMAPIGAIMDTYEKIFERNELSAIGGPSAEITSNIVSSAWSALGNLINGRPTLLTEDLVQSLRGVAGINNIVQGYGIMQHGVYKSKFGVAVPGEMSTINGLAALLGLTPQRAALWYGSRSDVAQNDKELAKVRKYVNTKAEEAFKLLWSADELDVERGTKLLNELNDVINTSGLSVGDQMSLRRSLTRPLSSQYNRIVKRLLETDKQYTAHQLSRITEGNQ